MKYKGLEKLLKVKKSKTSHSRFGGGGRAQKKQSVIDKLKAFFEKFFGIGGSITFTEQEQTKES